MAVSNEPKNEVVLVKLEGVGEIKDLSATNIEDDCLRSSSENDCNKTDIPESECSSISSDSNESNDGVEIRSSTSTTTTKTHLRVKITLRKVITGIIFSTCCFL